MVEQPEAPVMEPASDEITAGVDVTVPLSIPPLPQHVQQQQLPQIRAKRPRFITAGMATAASTEAKRLKPPSEMPGVVTEPREPNAKEECAFCLLKGSVRECEGVLMGPFRVTTRDPKKPLMIYAHRNCVMWSPEGFENEKGRLQQVDMLYHRARNKKCTICTGKGATLGCMYMGARCCRPMHFRCALLTGATLRDGYKTFCPRHADYCESKDEPMHLLEKTPVSEVLIKQGNGCLYCPGDSYDRARGTILTCNKCCGRAHSKCINPKLKNDTPFANNAFEEKHYCQNCMPCKVCDRPVDKRAYEQQMNHMSASDGLDLNLGNEMGEDCDTLLCVGCNHFAVHIKCLPPDPDNSRRRWRCHLCYKCRHCDEVNVPVDKWNEEHEACARCYECIQKGDVICPVCDKLYREFEDIPMVQCDVCDSWIHAIMCGGFTEESFKELQSKPSEVYRCPICVEKGKREPGRRRSKPSKGERNYPAKQTHSDALKSVLAKVPSANRSIAFYCVRTALREDKKLPIKALSDLAISKELCRHCCSGDVQDSLRFCSVCGDCFHNFCDDALAGRGNFNSLSEDRRGWQCNQCKSRLGKAAKATNQKRVTAARANGTKNSSEPVVNGNGSVTVTCRVVGEGYGMGWKDDRLCEFCQRGEEADSVEGRLLAWGSTMNCDLCDIWVHLGCAMWSVGVIFQRTNGHCDTIFGPRRAILGLAKRSRCASCGKTGATVKCSIGDCGQLFHFSCATNNKMRCIVSGAGIGTGEGVSVGDDVDYAQLNALDQDNVQLVCGNHEARDTRGAVALVHLMELVKMDRMVRVLDSQGFGVGAEASKQRVVSMDRVVSLRVGSLCVLRFGKVIPEVNDFIVNGCLVPLGYCAARRYWSRTKLGCRCTYFFEVSGHAQSGPVFVIRSSEDSDFKVEHTSVDIAWGQVWRQVMIAQSTEWMGEMVHSGLELFGLEGCAAVVQHIESLPLASMFYGRYEVKSGVAERGKSSEFVFYDSLAANYVPPQVRVNETGCSRTEGYVRGHNGNGKSLPAHLLRGQPVIKNVRSGSAFQLRVIREALQDKDDNKTERMSGYGPNGSGVVNVAVGRTRRSSLASNGGVDGSGNGENGVIVISDGGGSGAGGGVVPLEEGRSKVRSKKVSMAAAEKRDRLAVEPTTPLANLAPFAKQFTQILRSEIDGWGVYALTDIAAGELIMEYVGQIIRPSVSDLRELKYSRRGIGCYMFEIVPGMIVDATVSGNAARYINHSCAPNCFSKTISVDNRNVVAIYSKRRIQRGEELSYDYQFPYDDSDRIKCGCGAVQCRGFMN